MVKQEQESYLTGVARTALPRWGIGEDAVLKLLTLSKNGMFLVTWAD